jgi:hypothetical protein
MRSVFEEVRGRVERRGFQEERRERKRLRRSEWERGIKELHRKER